MFNKSSKNVVKKKQIFNKYSAYEVDSINYKRCSGYDPKKGGYGSIYAVTKDGEDKIYAAKVLHNNNKDDSDQELQFYQEIDILIKFQHPTFIKFHGYSLKDFDQNDNFTIYMDYAKNGNLEDYIKKNLSNTKLQIILIGISYGMMYMHKRKYIHRDLKPQNILLDDNFYPLITDFGTSREIDRNELCESCKGTVSYEAPEVLNGEPYDEKIDVYSFGILMYEVVSRKSAFSEKGKKLGYYQIMSLVADNKRPKFKPETKECFKNLISRCWDEYPDKRPSFEEIFCKLSGNNKNLKNDDDDFEDETSKCCLDDINMDEIQAYIKSISIEESDSSSEVGADLLISGDRREDPRRFAKNEKENQNLHLEDENWKLKYEQLQKEFLEFKNGTFQEKQENFDFVLNGNKNQIDKLKKTNNKLLNENKILSDENEDLKKKLDILQNKNKEVEKQINDLKNENNDLYILNDEKENTINDLKAQISNSNRLNDEKENTINDLKAQISNSNRLNDEKENTINDLRKEVANLNEELNNLKEENENEINTLRGENALLNEVNRENIVQIRNFERLPEINLDLEKQVRFLTHSQEDLKNQIRKLEKEKLNDIDKKRRKSQISSSKTDQSIPDINEKEKSYKKCFIDGFNSIDLKSQHTYISEILKNSSNSRLNISLSSIQSLLNYMLNFDFPERINLIQISSDQLYDQNLDSTEFYISINRIYIRSKATEILYHNRCFNDLRISEFLKLLDRFDDTIIEIKYPSDPANLFDDIYRIVISKMTHTKVSVFISGINETDLEKFRNNDQINYVIIDSNVSIIKGGLNGSFSSCKLLKKVIIPKSVNLIGSFAFSRCTSLTSITIPASVKVIQPYAFKECESLKIVTIVSNCSIESIGSQAFFGCTSLTTISIPTSITSIEEKTFYNCKSLKKIKIPCKISSIKEEAFFNCISLKNIEFVSPIGENIKTVAKLVIEKGAFRSCESIKGLYFPTHLDKIGAFAFSDCTNFEAMTFLSKLSSIDTNAFNNCPIVEVNLPKDIEKMFSRSNIKQYGIKTKVAVYPE